MRFGARVACIFGALYIKKHKDSLFNNYFDDWFEDERKRNEMLKKQNEIGREEKQELE